MAENKLFFGGIPTDVDIRALRDAFPDSGLAVGKLIGYEEVERVVRCKRASARFKTVTSRWRRLVEKDTGMIIGVEPTRGFVVLDDHEKLELSCQKVRSGVKFTRRGIRVAGHVERKGLSDEERRRYDLLTVRAAAILGAAQIRGNDAGLPTLLT
jgi:hypothetical protein